MDNAMKGAKKAEKGVGKMLYSALYGSKKLVKSAKKAAKK